MASQHFKCATKEKLETIEPKSAKIYQNKNTFSSLESLPFDFNDIQSQLSTPKQHNPSQQKFSQAVPLEDNFTLTQKLESALIEIQECCSDFQNLTQQHYFPEEKAQHLQIAQDSLDMTNMAYEKTKASFQDTMQQSKELEEEKSIGSEDAKSCKSSPTQKSYFRDEAKMPSPKFGGEDHRRAEMMKNFLSVKKKDASRGVSGISGISSIQANKSRQSVGMANEHRKEEHESKETYESDRFISYNLTRNSFQEKSSKKRSQNNLHHQSSFEDKHELIAEYKHLLRATSEEKNSIFSLLKQKDEQLSALQQHNAEIQRLYIANLEAQLQQKDQLIQNLMEAVKEQSARAVSQNCRPVVYGQEIRDEPIQIQRVQVREDFERQKSVGKIDFKAGKGDDEMGEEQKIEIGERVEVEEMKVEEEVGFQKVKVADINEKKQPEQTGFFKAGNVDRKLKVQTKNVSRIMALLSDDSEEDEPVQKIQASPPINIDIHKESRFEQKQQPYSCNPKDDSSVFKFKNNPRNFTVPSKRPLADTNLASIKSSKHAYVPPSTTTKVSHEDVQFVFSQDFSPQTLQIKASSPSQFQKPLSIFDIGEAQCYQVACYCGGEKEVQCLICSGRGKVGPQEMFGLLSQGKNYAHEEFDVEWVQNAYRHVVWKLAGLQRFVQENILTFTNILYQLSRRLQHEFIDGKRSFFQRCLQKDESISRHFIGLICSISNSNGCYTVEVSDGHYSFKSYLRRDQNSPNDDRVISLIEKKRIFVGQKLHFCHQTLGAYQPMQQNQSAKMSSFFSQTTKHHFLQNAPRVQLSLMQNGLGKAETWDKLGLQKKHFLIRGLGALTMKGGVVSMVDCVVARKYEPYFVEFVGGTRVLRSSQAMEERKRAMAEAFEEEAKVVGQASEEKVEALRKKYNVNYKMQFRIKVSDSLKQFHKAQITFQDCSEELFEYIKEGDRLKMLHLVPTSSIDSCLHLAFTKTSKFFNYSQSVLKSRDPGLQATYAQLVEKSVPLAQFKQEFLSLKEMPDLNLYGQILKVLTHKNSLTNEVDVWKVLLLTNEQDLVCIEVCDRSFFTFRCFPKEGQLVFVDNLAYGCSLCIAKRDNSFRVMDFPGEQLRKGEFQYEQLKLGAKGAVKGVKEAPEKVGNLKLFAKDKTFMKEVQTKVKSIINQGIKLQSQVYEASEIEEI